MFKGYNLSLPRNFYEGYELFVENKVNAIDKVVEDTIDSFADPNGVVDGSKLRANWFPKIEADIFLSHSHADRTLAMNLAGWIQLNFELTVFIDSCVWNHSDNLLRLIDNHYCYNEEEKIYNYKMRNRSTSHVYMMLSTALSEMMDRCECVMFLNTPSSINADHTINKTSTFSPWIYSEIATTRLMRKQNPREIVATEGKRVIKEAANFSVEYDVDLSHLIKIGEKEIEKWQSDCGSHFKKHDHPLEVLYELYPGEK